MYQPGFEAFSLMHSCNTADSCIRGQSANVKCRKIRDTKTFIVWTCRSPLLHVCYNGGILLCQNVKDKHTWSKFLSATTSKGFMVHCSKIRVNSSHNYIGGYASRNANTLSKFLSAREIHSMNVQVEVCRLCYWP